VLQATVEDEQNQLAEQQAAHRGCAAVGAVLPVPFTAASQRCRTPSTPRTFLLRPHNRYTTAALSQLSCESDAASPSMVSVRRRRPRWAQPDFVLQPVAEEDSDAEEDFNAEDDGHSAASLHPSFAHTGPPAVTASASQLGPPGAAQLPWPSDLSQSGLANRWSASSSSAPGQDSMLGQAGHSSLLTEPHVGALGISSSGTLASAKGSMRASTVAAPTSKAGTRNQHTEGAARRGAGSVVSMHSSLADQAALCLFGGGSGEDVFLRGQEKDCWSEAGSSVWGGPRFSGIQSVADDCSQIGVPCTCTAL
jgi:hypothetical protein